MTTRRKPLEQNDLKIQLQVARLKETFNHIQINKNNNIQIPEDIIYEKAYKMALTYEDILGIYLKKPALKYIKSKVDFEKNIAVWKRVVSVCEQVTYDYETYVKSQFWVYEKLYCKAPKPYELALVNSKYPSIDKYNNYMKALVNNQVGAATNIVTRVRKNPIVPKEEKFAQCNYSLKQLMKNYNTSEEEVLKAFAKGSQAALYFDLDWLNQNPTYIKLKSEGFI